VVRDGKIIHDLDGYPTKRHTYHDIAGIKNESKAKLQLENMLSWAKLSAIKGIHFPHLLEPLGLGSYSSLFPFNFLEILMCYSYLSIFF
jgi:DNA primase